MCLRACLRCFSSQAGLFTRVYCACGLVFVVLSYMQARLQGFLVFAGSFVPAGLITKFLLCLRVCL